MPSVQRQIFRKTHGPGSGTIFQKKQFYKNNQCPRFSDKFSEKPMAPGSAIIFQKKQFYKNNQCPGFTENFSEKPCPCVQRQLLKNHGPVLSDILKKYSMIQAGFIKIIFRKIHHPVSATIFQNIL